MTGGEEGGEGRRASSDHCRPAGRTDGSAAHHTGRTILPCYSPAEQTKHPRKHYFEGRSLEFKEYYFPLISINCNLEIEVRSARPS